MKSLIWENPSSRVSQQTWTPLRFIPKHCGSPIRAWHSASPPEVILLNFLPVSPWTCLFHFQFQLQWVLPFFLLLIGCEAGSTLWVLRSDFSLEWLLLLLSLFHVPKVSSHPSTFLTPALVSRKQTHMKSQGPCDVNPVTEHKCFLLMDKKNNVIDFI